MKSQKGSDIIKLANHYISSPNHRITVYENALEGKVLIDEDKEITEEDIENIRKWITSTSMMIEAKLRTTWSDSEIKTGDKIHKIECGY